MGSDFDYIEMKIPAKPEYVSVIRLTLSGIANRMGFGYEVIEDLKIATSEAITNAVYHAYEESDAEGEVLIGFGLYQNRMEVIVSDTGQSFDFDKTSEETGPYAEDEPVALMREGGLGLYLIKSLMDDVKVKVNQGVTVHMIKYLEGEQVDTSDQVVST